MHDICANQNLIWCQRYVPYQSTVSAVREEKLVNMHSIDSMYLFIYLFCCYILHLSETK